MIYIIILLLTQFDPHSLPGTVQKMQKNAKEQNIDSTNYGAKFILCYSTLLSNEDSGSKWANEVKYNINIREPT